MTNAAEIHAQEIFHNEKNSFFNPIIEKGIFAERPDGTHAHYATYAGFAIAKHQDGKDLKILNEKPCYGVTWGPFAGSSLNRSFLGFGATAKSAYKKAAENLIKQGLTLNGHEISDFISA